jgi:hypothetical protein
MWDPYGSDIDSCGWVIHRTWRSMEYCLAKMRSGQWSPRASRLSWPTGARRSTCGPWAAGHATTTSGRPAWKPAGSRRANFTDRGEHVHELWEWHDGTRVWTVLDRELLVVDGENPVVGMKPFMAYRPTPLQKQMVGIGDLEPLEHLQRETDTTRSQARIADDDAGARLGLRLGAVDEEDLIFAPNAAIEVRNARPSDAILPLPRSPRSRPRRSRSWT